MIPCITLYIPTSIYLIGSFIPNCPIYTPQWLLCSIYAWFPICMKKSEQNDDFDIYFSYDSQNPHRFSGSNRYHYAHQWLSEGTQANDSWHIQSGKKWTCNSLIPLFVSSLFLSFSVRNDYFSHLIDRSKILTLSMKTDLYLCVQSALNKLVIFVRRFCIISRRFNQSYNLSKNIINRLNLTLNHFSALMNDSLTHPRDKQLVIVEQATRIYQYDIVQKSAVKQLSARVT